jgi:hypothetical protein
MFVSIEMVVLVVSTDGDGQNERFPCRGYRRVSRPVDADFPVYAVRVRSPAIQGRIGYPRQNNPGLDTKICLQSHLDSFDSNLLPTSSEGNLFLLKYLKNNSPKHLNIIQTVYLPIY